MSEIIDAFTHYLPPEFYDELRANHGFQGLSGDPGFLWDVEQRLADMDEFGIDKQVITLALPPVWRGMTPEDALPLTRQANDAVRDLADEYPDAFVPVGTLPYPDGAFLDEYERCVNDLGMDGIQIFSNVEGRPIDGDEFEELYARAARNGTPLWLHPQLHEWYDWASEYMDHRLFGWPFDTTLALSRLVFGGVLERHDVDIVSHHLGGMIPFYGGRIQQFYETRVEYPENYGLEFPDFSTPPIEQFRNFYADTAISGSTPALRCGETFFADDRIVFGTDYPFGPDRGRTPMRRTMDAIEDAFDAESQSRVYAENVRTLL